MFNATLNNISAILWQSFLWWKPPTNLPQITDKLDHKVVLSVADKVILFKILYTNIFYL
jgi:hypothetical protein